MHATNDAVSHVACASSLTRFLWISFLCSVIHTLPKHITFLGACVHRGASLDVTHLTQATVGAFAYHGVSSDVTHLTQATFTNKKKLLAHVLWV